MTVHAEAAVRLQQLCGAATAKSMEDCLFYRDARLVSLNEVGGEPERFGVSVAEFHQRAAVRAAAVAAGDDDVDHPRHQTRRGRAGPHRSAVAGAVAVGGIRRQAGSARTPSPDPLTGLFLWQNIFGVWPIDGQVTDELRDRLHAYAEKAIREAAVHTTWNDPDAEFETAVHAWLDAVIDGPVATELTALVARLDEHARSDALGQKLIALTAPGSSRRLPGHRTVGGQPGRPGQPPAGRLLGAARGADGAEPPQDAGRDGGAAAAAREARHLPDRWLHAACSPQGRAAAHLVAFLRGDDVLVAVSRHGPCGSPKRLGRNRSLSLPDGDLERPTRPVPIQRARCLPTDLFAELPVALLERADGLSSRSGRRGPNASASTSTARCTR